MMEFYTLSPDEWAQFGETMAKALGIVGVVLILIARFGRD